MHVTLESLVQYATLVTVVTGFVSLVVFARIYGRQVNAQIVIELFARYAAMHQSFPAQLRVALFGSDRSLPERREEFTACALQYAMIVSFAYHLHERRYITNDIWAIMETEHQQTISRPWFAREWNTVQGQFAMFPSFVAYVERFLPNHGQAQV
jgi:hypothetical protein